MRFKNYYKAAFQTRNLILLVSVVIISFLTEFLPFTLIGLAGYIYFVLQTIQSEKFQKQLIFEGALDHLQGLSAECQHTYQKVYRQVGPAARQRLDAIMTQKKELEEYFVKNADESLNKTIIEQALQLVIAYSKLLLTYSLRLKEVNAMDTQDLLDRINRNNRKLGSLESYDAVLKLTQAIEMDEKLVKEIQEQKNEVEMIGVKLDHIESMISAFKHQIISSDAVNPAVGEIESIVNEAMALDNALRENRRQQL